MAVPGGAACGAVQLPRRHLRPTVAARCPGAEGDGGGRLSNRAALHLRLGGRPDRRPGPTADHAGASGHRGGAGVDPVRRDDRQSAHLVGTGPGGARADPHRRFSPVPGSALGGSTTTSTPTGWSRTRRPGPPTWRPGRRSGWTGSTSAPPPYWTTSPTRCWRSRRCAGSDWTLGGTGRRQRSRWWWRRRSRSTSPPSWSRTPPPPSRS